MIISKQKTFPPRRGKLLNVTCFEDVILFLKCLEGEAAQVNLR